MKLYLDTNVFISFWKDEIAKGKTPIYFGYSSERLLEEIINCKHSLITSKLVALEIKQKYPYMLEDFRKEIEKLKPINKVRILEIPDWVTTRALELNKEAKRKEEIKLGWKDCAHMLMAKEDAEAFVSWEKGQRVVAEMINLDFYSPDELLG